MIKGKDLSLITKVTLDNPTQDSLDFVLNNFPNVTTLTLTGQKLTPNWIESHISYLQGSNIKELTISAYFFQNFKPFSLSLPGVFGLKKLTLNWDFTGQIIEISIPKEEQLKLILDKTSSPSKIIRRGGDIQLIENDEPVLSTEEWGTVTHAVMEFRTIEELKKSLEENPGNEKALIISCGLTSQDCLNIAKRFPKLKYLEIINSSSEILLSDMSSLEYLQILTNDDISIKNCPQLHSLVIADNGIGQIKIQSDILPNLRDLRIQNMIDRELIERFPVIETVTIVSNFDCSLIKNDLYKIKTLKKFIHINRKNGTTVTYGKIKDDQGNGRPESETKSSPPPSESKQPALFQTPPSHPSFKGVSFFTHQTMSSPHAARDKAIAPGTGKFLTLLQHNAISIPVMIIASKPLIASNTKIKLAKFHF